MKVGTDARNQNYSHVHDKIQIDDSNYHGLDLHIHCVEDSCQGRVVSLHSNLQGSMMMCSGASRDFARAFPHRPKGPQKE